MLSILRKNHTHLDRVPTQALRLDTCETPQGGRLHDRRPDCETAPHVSHSETRITTPIPCLHRVFSGFLESSGREAERRRSAPDEEVSGDVVAQDDGVTGGPDEPHPAGADTQLHLGSGDDLRVLEAGDDLRIGLDRLPDAADDSRDGLTAGEAVRADLIGRGSRVLRGPRRDRVAEGSWRRRRG